MMVFDIEQFDVIKRQKKRRRERLSSLTRIKAAEWLRENIDESGVVVSVTQVEFHEDFSQADIFVLVYPESKEKDVLKKLQSMEKELRHHLAQNVRFKRVPEITISKDKQELARQRVEQLFEKIKKE